MEDGSTLINKGGYGEIYLSPDRKKVFKIQKWRWYSQEIEIYERVGLFGLSPKLLEYKKQKDKEIIILEAMEGNLFGWRGINQKGVFTKWNTETLLELIWKFHDLGYVHNDIGLPNFLYDKGNRFYLCDFGFSVKYEPHFSLRAWKDHQAIDYYLLYEALMSSRKDCLPQIKEAFEERVWPTIRQNWCPMEKRQNYDTILIPEMRKLKYIRPDGIDPQVLNKIEKLL